MQFTDWFYEEAEKRTSEINESLEQRKAEQKKADSTNEK